MTHGTLGMDVRRLAKDAQTAICIFSTKYVLKMARLSA